MLSSAEQQLIKVCCEFLELIYDPFLTWRHFVRKHRLTSSGSSYHVDPQLHPEIVPFIYTCFEDLPASKRSALHNLGSCLLNVLGGIAIGSSRNGRLVICPATINVIMKIIGDWSMEEAVRKRALDNANLMLIVLVKSSPVERQIEVDIVIQEYMLAIQSLLKRCPSVDEDDCDQDKNALLSILQNVCVLLCEPSTKTTLCNSLLDGSMVNHFVEIPEKIREWDVDVDQHMSVIVQVIALVSYSVKYQLPEKALRRLFHGLRQSSSSSSLAGGEGVDRKRIVEQCLSLATNPNDALALNTMVVNELINWVPTLNRSDQELVISSLMDVCSRNSNRLVQSALTC